MIQKSLNIKALTQTESNAIWALKAVAIFTVFFAHMPWHDPNSIMYTVYQYMGIIGVPIFLYLSGYLAAGGAKTFIQQVKYIVVPTLIYGSLTFVISFVITDKPHTPSMTILGDYIRWIVGSGSIYYFITVLLFCHASSKIINDWILVAISILSIFLSWNYLPHNEIFTRYLNPFNFIIYYSLGRIARKYDFNPIGKYYIACSIIALISIIVLWKDNHTYFNLYCIPFSAASFILLYNIVYFYNNAFLIKIGKISFVIYLIHIQIAGIINSLFTKFRLEHIKVFVAFFTVCAIVFILQKIINAFCSKNWVKYFGFR